VEILKVHELNFSYDGKTQAVSDVSFNAQFGEYISIIGSNGSGKSTLFSLLCGHRKPHGGKIFLYDKPLDNYKNTDIAKIISVIYQKNEINLQYNCFEFVLMGLYPHRMRFEKITNAALSRAEEIMDITDTLKFAEKQINQISGGETQRVLLAKALMQQPKILMMDEAMSDIDAAVKIKLIKLLRKKAEHEGLCIIAIHHDLSLVYRYSDRVLTLKNGKQHNFGSTGQVFNDEMPQNIFGIKGEVIKNKGFLIYDNIY
jgi:iron complex transport system ATP-binding protein